MPFLGLDDATATVTIIAGILGVAVVFMAGHMAGAHSRQHWETDRIVESKLMRD